MLGIGIGEMILIAGLALIVFGPEKFPDLAKIVLRTTRDLRGYMDDIQREVSKEIKPIKKELDQLNKYDPEKYIDALTKETPTKKADTAAKKHNTNTAPADPTDRQDDSFDYTDTAPADHPDEDPYGNQDITGGVGNTKVAPSEDKTEEHQPEQQPEQPAPPKTDTDEDDFDFSEPPVERMD